MTAYRPIFMTRIVRNEFEEWHVLAYDERGERMRDADYFTDDYEDAAGTALAMTAKRPVQRKGTQS